ncbi:phage holin family protein [Risungbinella massiliensis]|uniref:phage holin family protein n=1 Tax=Risungbinella massiliensis TaxID=1329796 RepID=UPI001E40E1A8|nr:phage holin family protein [Risungbinella massiliensis]
MLSTILRFLVATLVLIVTAALTPGFRIGNFFSAMIAAILIALIGWAVESMTQDKISPFAKGGIGFITSAIILYLVQFIVPGFRITLFGTLIASLIIAFFNLFLPTTRRKLTT